MYLYYRIINNDYETMLIHVESYSITLESCKVLQLLYYTFDPYQNDVYNRDKSCICNITKETAIISILDH